MGSRTSACISTFPKPTLKRVLGKCRKRTAPLQIHENLSLAAWLNSVDRRTFQPLFTPLCILERHKWLFSVALCHFMQVQIRNIRSQCSSGEVMWLYFTSRALVPPESSISKSSQPSTRFYCNSITYSLDTTVCLTTWKKPFTCNFI